MPMSEKHTELRRHIASLRKSLGMEIHSVGTALKRVHRKKVGGIRVAYYKPLSERRKRAPDKVGDVSYTIVNPESVTNKCRAKCARKYHAWLRKVNADLRTDAIQFDF